MTFIIILLLAANAVILGMGHKLLKEIKKLIEDNIPEHNGL